MSKIKEINHPKYVDTRYLISHYSNDGERITIKEINPNYVAGLEMKVREMADIMNETAKLTTKATEKMEKLMFKWASERKAEKNVLGSLMVDSNGWHKVKDVLVEDDFVHTRKNRMIFRVMKELAEESSPLDAITVAESIDRHGYTEETGGLEYLAELTRETPNALNIEEYAEVIRGEL